MKKGVSIIAIIFSLLLSLCLFSCESNREYDEGEVISAAEALIKKSILMNEIFYGDGIPYVKNESLASGYYYPADEIYLENAGFSTVEQLEATLREVYSTALSDIIIETKLNPVSDDEGIKSFARYYQKYSSIEEDATPECIMVYSLSDVLLDSDVEYDYSSITVLGSKGESVKVQMMATVTNSEGDSQKRAITVSLIEEENGWRLDTPSYLRYMNMDYYEDIQSK